jgi:hypothetical protein
MNVIRYQAQYAASDRKQEGRVLAGSQNGRRKVGAAIMGKLAL